MEMGGGVMWPAVRGGSVDWEGCKKKIDTYHYINKSNDRFGDFIILEIGVTCVS